MKEHQFSRRERQIMDAVFARGKASVADIRAEMPDPPSYSAVRAMVGRLEAKGFLKHSEKGARYVYQATLPRKSAQVTALDRLIRTLFEGSPRSMIATLLEAKREDLDDDELAALAELIESARKKGG